MTLVPHSIDLTSYVYAAQGDPLRIRLRFLCLSSDGNEVSGIMDRVSLFTTSNPWGKCNSLT